MLCSTFQLTTPTLSPDSGHGSQLAALLSPPTAGTQVSGAAVTSSLDHQEGLQFKVKGCERGEQPGSAEESDAAWRGGFQLPAS